MDALRAEVEGGPDTTEVTEEAVEAEVENAPSEAPEAEETPAE